MVELLAAAGFEAREDPERGWDHGVFIPLKVMDPDARVPIVAMSLRRSMDPTEHLAIGAALAPLRDEGVLILGSGMSYHNLRAFGPAGAEAAETFDTWLTDAVEGPAVERDARLASWTEAPAARQAHPHEDHLLPTMVAAGAARGEPGRRIYGDPVMGLAISGYAFGA